MVVETSLDELELASEHTIADRLHRQWVGIDISDVAVRLVEERIKADQGLFQDIKSRTDIPGRTDLGVILKYNDARNKKSLYGEQGGNCNGCGKHFEPRNLEIDHIIARAQGGTDHLDNLQLLCGYCNRVKGDRGQEYLIAKLAA
ncbi:MAG: HNH endonuclease signature motif containing protein [Gammaproteobacteria bacterium]|nr:HNH endonuclease signature motif containing protein [Gammaproteobacteria bacterium]